MSAPSPDGKRRLPLLPKVEVAEEGDEDRPPWHWAAIGCVGVFVFWLPLAFTVNGLLAVGTGAVGVLLNAAAFGLACFGSGLLVGRFGGKAGKREATAGGVAASVLSCLLAAVQLRGGVVTWILIVAVFVALGGSTSLAGGALGLRLRKP